MSGVNYGLFGFLWMRGRFDRDVMWRLNPTVVWTLMIWFVVCFTGLLGPAAWGFLCSGKLRLSR
jgi:GlpG protein